jgi:hypothetical protein
MLNPFNDVNWNPDRAQRRSFAISLIVGFPCLALLFLLIGYLRGQGWRLDTAFTIGGVGAAAGAIFLLLPAIVRPFYLAWYFLACCFGFVIGNILMALLFYVFIGGLGLVMRAVGRRGMRTELDRSAPTYWLDAGPAPDGNRYFRQF